MASLTPPKKTLEKKGESVKSLLKRGFGGIKKIFPYYSLFEAGIMAYHSLQDVLGVEEKRTDMPGSEELAAHSQKGKQVTTIDRHKFNQIVMRMGDKMGGSVREEQDPAGRARSQEERYRARDALNTFEEKMMRRFSPRHFRIEEIKADITRLQTAHRSVEDEERERDLRKEMRELEALPSDRLARHELERRLTPKERKYFEKLKGSVETTIAHAHASISGDVKGGRMDLAEFYREINDVDNHPHAIEMRRRWLERMRGQGHILEDSIGTFRDRDLTREDWRDIIDMERNTSLEEAAQRGDAATVRDIEINYSNYQEEEARMNRTRAGDTDMVAYDPDYYSESMEEEDLRRANRRNPLADPYAGSERRGRHGGRRYGQDYVDLERPPDDDPIPF